MTRFQRPRGTRDYMPEDARKLREVAERIRKVFELYGYGEVITPAFEHLELLVAKAGEDVVKQIYDFRDKAGRLLGLRFEMTTPIARIIASNPMVPKPIRLYYVQPVWRYEEPQHGRYREFWQAGVELIGVGSPEGDAEVVALTIRALKRAGLKKFIVKVNDRELVEGILESFGVPPSLWPRVMRAIDKLEKRGRGFVEKELAEAGMGLEKARGLLDLLDKLRGRVDALGDTETMISERLRRGLKRLQEILEELEQGYGIESEVEVDTSIVRGLDYYTSFVFEVKVPGVGVGSVAGGGRYDDLIKLVGGPDLPATGMAIGLERLIEAIEHQGTDLGAYREALVAVIPVDASLRAAAARAAESLRDADIPTVLEFGSRRLGKALERADKAGVRFAVIVGERELREGVFTVRDMAERVQERVKISELVNYIKAKANLP